MSRFFVYIVIFFCLLIIIGCCMLYGVVAGIKCLIKRPKPRFLPYAIATLVGIAFTLSIISYGYYIGRWELEKNEVELKYDSLPPAFEGYTIVHLSDLHLNTFIGHEDQLQRIIDSVNSAQPDLICFTGDLISLDTAEIRPLAPLLRTLKAKDGIYSVLGNHDFMPYGREEPDYDRVAAIMTDLETELLGWRVLNNEHVTIRRGEDAITLMGCMNWSDEGFPLFHRSKHPPLQKGDLDKAMEGTSGFRILLTHDPSQWHALLLEPGRDDVALTLSGHTHCGQMRVGEWTPAKWFFDEVRGLYASPPLSPSASPPFSPSAFPPLAPTERSLGCLQPLLSPAGALLSPQGAKLYVNTGLGCTAPIRIAVPMEVTVVVLR